jgi:hypothetical protein
MALAKALSLKGGNLPDPEQLFSFNSPFERAAMLIARMVGNLPPGEDRGLFNKSLIREATPLSFSAEIVRWLPEDPGSSPHPLTREEKKALATIVASRCQDVADGDTFLFEAFPRHAAHLASFWATYGSRESLDSHVRAYLELQPTIVHAVLLAYVPTAYPIGGGLPHKSDFERHQYDALAASIDPSIIYNAVEVLYRGQTAPSEYPRWHEGPLEARVAIQFAWLHNYVKSEKDQSQSRPQDPI